MPRKPPPPPNGKGIFETLDVYAGQRCMFPIEVKKACELGAPYIDWHGERILVDPVKMDAWIWGKFGKNVAAPSGNDTAAGDQPSDVINAAREKYRADRKGGKGTDRHVDSE
jgi:hypothetical protein